MDQLCIAIIFLIVKRKYEMFKFIRNSDIMLRLSLNPFLWHWKPHAGYEVLVWLFFELYVDIFDGEIIVPNFLDYNDGFGELREDQ
jgi:hypothetical protein